MIDLNRVRADTLGVGDIVHLDNCGSSLPPQPVVDAHVDYLRTEQRIGGYRAATRHADQLDDFHAASAEMLGCGTDEVAFQSGASEAWWRAFTAVRLAPGDRVVTGTSEFQANAFGLLQARDRGVVVEVVPNDSSGTIDLGALAQALERPGAALVCLTQVSMSNGAVQPAAGVGALTRAHGVTYLLDACQVAGQRRLVVDEIGCDFLVYTGRKFMRGPRGAGVLYARRSTVDRLGPTPFVDGRSALWHDDDTWRHEPGATRFEWGERNYGGQVALGVATRYALDIGLDAIEHRVVGLADSLRGLLGEIDGVQVHDEGEIRSGIVTFTVAGVTAADAAAQLDDRGIQVGAPGRRNAQWDLGRRGLEAVVRVGVHYFNTGDELDSLVGAVTEISAAGRPRS